MNLESLKRCWSKPHVIGIIQFLLNSERSTETGITPFQYLFGSVDAKYMILPPDSEKHHAGYLKLLNEDLLKVRQAAKKVQEIEQEKRNTHEILNAYAVGDYVLFDEASKGFREEKLKPRYSGPYMVTQVYKADVTCRHIVTGKEKVFHMEHLKPFMGSLREAYDAAKADDDQFVIVKILDYVGDPEKRMSMSFLVLFEGNDEVWLDYNADLASSSPFKDYCELYAKLEPIRMPAAVWKVQRSRYSAQPITDVKPGDRCFVNLKAWGDGYFRALQLPFGPRYVVECSYVRWTNARKKKIDVYCPIFDQLFEWDAVAVRLHGLSNHLIQGMILVDVEFGKEYPKVME